MRTMVIAECGSCHDAELDKALALVRTARETGCDVAKFQYFSSAKTLARRRNAARLQPLYEKYQMPREWITILATEARRVGIAFGCSTYLPEDVWPVAEYASVLKISSFEAAALDLLDAHRPAMLAGRQVVVSLGMGADARKASAVLWRGVSASDNSSIKAPLFLHCTSAYPAFVEELNLRRISEEMNFDVRRLHGLSDHTVPSDENKWIGALAVAAGATVIERHLRLLTTSGSNPDYRHSSSPDHMRAYVERVRYAELAYGHAPYDGPTLGERESLAYRVGVQNDEGQQS